jgi:hypothetical integral membrane protein (TIGR02206 family)
MATNFHLFGAAHCLILAAILLVPAALAVFERRVLLGKKWLRICFGIVMVADAAAWYSFLAVIGQPIFPGKLPLELCDASFFLVAIVLLTGSRALFDVAYYWALAGTSMALLTPNLIGHFPSISTAQFFIWHGLVVSGTLYLIWSGEMRPRPGSVLRAMVALNLIAVLDGVFDAVFKTDYMYLGAKPQNVSLLSYMGPWPWYVLTAEPVALGLFLLLYWPFRRRGREGDA